MESQRINLSIKEIYSKLCPKCQAKLRELLKDKIADQAVKDALGEGKG